MAIQAMIGPPCERHDARKDAFSGTRRPKMQGRPAPTTEFGIDRARIAIAYQCHRRKRRSRTVSGRLPVTAPRAFRMLAVTLRVGRS